MTKHAAPGAAQACVEARRLRIVGATGRPLAAVAAGSEPLSTERLAFLTNEARELYWDELCWEELTDEERVVGGPLTEMVFPGLLAFVDGLLLEKPANGATAAVRPHPDAVEELLLFLGERFATLSGELEAGADSERLVWARAMTGRLIDLVLYRLYRLAPDEREELDALA